MDRKKKQKIKKTVSPSSVIAFAIMPMVVDMYTAFPFTNKVREAEGVLVALISRVGKMPYI